MRFGASLGVGLILDNLAVLDLGLPLEVDDRCYLLDFLGVYVAGAYAYQLYAVGYNLP